MATSLSPASAQTSLSDTASVLEIDPPAAPSPADAAAIRPVLDEPPPSSVTPTQPAANEQYAVAAGDSFWSVAAAHLSDVTGRADLVDAEVAGYWRDLMASNPLPNPDLLFVGQVIELPAATL
jgi:nucleoid-associated protein YgaU